MNKSYCDRLADWIRARESTRRSRNLVAYLAVRDEVAQAVKAGYPVKTVWAHLHEAGRIPFGYETLLNYVNRTVRAWEKNEADAVPAPSSTPFAKKTNPHVSTRAPEVGVLPGFHFVSQPNKEDLL